MKIIVTGATGHIGSYLIRELGYQFKGFNFTGSLRRGIEETISLLRN